jgi:hypothetical protein
MYCALNMSVPLNAELNPICHLLALLGGATIVVVSRLRVKGLTSFEVSDALAAKSYKHATVIFAVSVRLLQMDSG